MIRSCIISALLVCTAITSMAQVERLSIQFDKGFYLSGENIWFRIGLHNNDTSELKSAICYVDLISPENKLLDHAKLKLDDRVASGSFSLPFTTDEGYYQLRVYTKYNLNYTEKGVLFTTIPIYNPLESEITSFVLEDSGKSEEIWNDKEIGLRLDGGSFKHRDTINLNISTTSKMSLSLSIIEAQMKEYDPPMLERNSGISSGIYEPEKTMSIDGMLTDLQTGEKITSPVISVYNGESRSFLRARSEEGRIKIPVPEFTGTSTFQVYNLNPYQQSVNNFEILALDYDFPEYENSNKPPMTESIAQYILKSKKRRKIHEILGMDLFRTSVTSTMYRQEVEPDYSYDMAKYQNISTLEEFIDEGVFAARVRKRKEKTEIRLFNAEDKFTFIDPPWYIVDGIITNDEKKVLAIPFKDIQEINLFTKTSTIKKYFEHFLWRNGVIEVITSDVKYRRQFSSEPNAVELQGYNQSPKFFDTLPIAGEYLPDVRGVICWSPDLRIQANTPLQIKVPHSDESGTFIIRVTGISETGEMYRKQLSYEVSGR